MRNPLLIFALRKSTKLSFKALAAASKTLLRAKRAHEKRLKRFSYSGWRRTFAVSFPEQPGGPKTILRRRTKSSFKKGTENQRMDNLRFSSIAKRYATGISFTVRSKIAYRRSPRVRTPAAYFKAHSRPFATPFFLIRVTVCRRQGGKVRAPHGGCAGRNQKTSRWDVFPYGCDRLVRSSHKQRTEVWALSAAVRPAFAVLIYAPEPSGKGMAILHEKTQNNLSILYIDFSLL